MDDYERITRPDGWTVELMPCLCGEWHVYAHLRELTERIGSYADRASADEAWRRWDPSSAEGPLKLEDVIRDIKNRRRPNP